MSYLRTVPLKYSLGGFRTISTMHLPYILARWLHQVKYSLGGYYTMITTPSTQVLARWVHPLKYALAARWISLHILVLTHSTVLKAEAQWRFYTGARGLSLKSRHENGLAPTNSNSG